VTDYVGIPKENINSLYIPFFSNKKQSETKSTGQMGTGFFNVFRGSDQVIVQTKTKDSIESVKVSSRPVRRGDNSIVDIEHKFLYTIPNNQFVGTSVTVYIPVRKNTIGSLGTLLLLQQLTKEVLQGVSIVKIRINGEEIRTENPEVSYIHTNGIPFQELSTFLRPRNFSSNVCTILARGHIVNLEKDQYTVNQSRDSLDKKTKTLSMKRFSLFFTIRVSNS
jgi:hypothetical protein